MENRKSVDDYCRCHRCGWVIEKTAMTSHLEGCRKNLGKKLTRISAQDLFSAVNTAAEPASLKRLRAELEKVEKQRNNTAKEDEDFSE